MTTAALTQASVPLMGIAAELAMGMFFAPATHVGVVDRAPRERLTDAARSAMVAGQGGRCAKCGVTLDASNTEIDHKWPIAKGGQNWAVNLQALCMPCNRSKGAKLEPVVMDILTGALPAVLSSEVLQRGRDWLTKLEFGKLLDAGNLTGQASALMPFMVISPTTAILIVGGVVLVVAGYFAVKWLLEHADGERRYVRLAQSLRESLSHLAHHAGRLARHLEGATEQARRLQSGMGGLASHAGGVAGLAALKARDASASAHAPTIAHHASRMAHDAGRVSGQVARTAGGIAGHAGRVSARRLGTAAGRVPVRVGNVAVVARDMSATRAPAMAGQALQLARGVAGRVSPISLRTPNFRGRKAAPVRSTTDGDDVAAGRWV